VDVSRHILVVDTSVLVKSNMSQREYDNFMATVWIWMVKIRLIFGEDVDIEFVHECRNLGIPFIKREFLK
jgi:hypothetical protein